MTAASPKPPLGRNLFRKYNVEKLVRSAKGAGLRVGGVEVAPDGTIRVLAEDGHATATANPWDSNAERTS